jgi:hypothetical protein
MTQNAMRKQILVGQLVVANWPAWICGAIDVAA